MHKFNYLIFSLFLALNFAACGGSSEKGFDVPIETVVEDSDIGGSYRSPYLEEISLPECDASNPEVHFVFTQSDMSELNNPDKRIFCFKPGDYSLNGRSVLTQSGTAEKPRYIILDNGNDIHPGKLEKSQLAKVGFVLDNTKYWIIDRISFWDSSDTLNPIMIKDSDHNIINRYFMDNVGNGIYIYPNSDYNTIQNCRIQRTEFSLFHDRAAIGINSDSRFDEFTKVSAINNKILNNEVYNFVDGFQTIRSGWYEDGRVDENNKSIVVITKDINYEGTIVDNNHFYIDTTIYTDCNGNHDPKGACAYAENGMDLKAGSDNPNNPMIISNNKMWGFRKSDETNSDLSDHGSSMPIHYGVYNTIIKNNVAFNANNGFGIGSSETNEFSMRDSHIINNIFSDIKEYAFYIDEVKNLVIDNNLIKDFSPIDPDIWGSQYWLISYYSESLSLSNNNITNVDNRSTRLVYPDNLRSVNNTYYAALPGDIPSSEGEVVEVDSSSEYKDLVFITDTFTKHPREIRVSKVLKN